MRRVLGVAWKEFRQIGRDPRMLRMIFVAPIIQLIVFGYAVSTDIRHTKTFVVDGDNSAASRAFVDMLAAGGYFRVVGRSLRASDAAHALEHGDALVSVIIPAGFAADLAAGGADMQVLVDGTSSNTATIAQGYVARMVERFSLAGASGARPSGVDLRERAWFNPELESRNYNVPGVVGALILLVCLLLTSLAVVRERELGTLEQLRVSPLTPGELIAGKVLPFAAIGMADVIGVSAIAMLWFGVPFRGNFAVLALASALYIMTALGAGLLLSTASRTQQEAFMGTFLIFMPTILLSGFMFPVTSMPAVFQWATLVNPVRHYIEIVRAVFLKGVGVGVLWPQFIALAVIGTALLALAVRRFRVAASA